MTCQTILHMLLIIIKSCIYSFELKNILVLIYVMDAFDSIIIMQKGHGLKLASNAFIAIVINKQYLLFFRHEFPQVIS